MKPMEPDTAIKMVYERDLSLVDLRDILEAVWQDGFDAGYQEALRGALD